MTRQRPWLPFALIASLVLVALLVSGLRTSQVRAFALGVPNIRKVAVAQQRRRVCEGPVRSPDAFQSVVVWGTQAGGAAHVQIWSDGHGARKLLSSGPIEPLQYGTFASYTAVLASAVDRNVPVDVCVVQVGGDFILKGYTPGYGGAAIADSKPGRAFAVAGFESGAHSFIGSLGLAFSRAALFKPSWVGRWTFWGLLILLLGTLPLAAFAISAAIRSEQEAGQTGDDLT